MTYNKRVLPIKRKYAYDHEKQQTVEITTEYINGGFKLNKLPTDDAPICKLGDDLIEWCAANRPKDVIQFANVRGYSWYKMKKLAAKHEYFGDCLEYVQQIISYKILEEWFANPQQRAFAERFGAMNRRDWREAIVEERQSSATTNGAGSIVIQMKELPQCNEVEAKRISIDERLRRVEETTQQDGGQG